MSSARFPTSRKSEAIPFPDELVRETLPAGDFHLQEERRLAYVAFTRAEKRLYLTCVERRGKKPSTFINEAVGDGSAVEVREVPEADFDPALESGTDLDLLDRDIRRQFIRMIEQPVSEAELMPYVDLLAFVREMKDVSEPDGWTKKIDEFEKGLGRQVSPAIGGRVLEVLGDAALLSTVQAEVEPEPLYLSYSRISTYEECPLGYKFGYVLRIPGRPQPYFSFGSSVHLALRRFFEELQSGKKPALDDLIAYYNDNWQKDGYVIKSQEEGYRKDGVTALEAVYQRHLAEQTVPLHLEWKFTTPVGPHFIHGYVDRIDPIGDGACHIIDYKTGKPKVQKDVDQDTQLTLYAIAVQQCLGLVPERLSLYFLSTDEMISTTRTEEQMEAAREKVLSVAECITARRFPPAVDEHRCGRCDYAALCPAREL